MILIQVWLALITLLVVVDIFFRTRKKIARSEQDEFKTAINSLMQGLGNTEINLKTEFVTNRKENAENSKALREEVSNQLNAFTKTFSGQLATLTRSNEDKLESNRRTIDENLKEFQVTVESNNKQSRKELKESFDAVKLEVSASLKDFGDRQRENFSELQKNQVSQNTIITSKLDTIRDTVENKITQLQEGNEKKLEEMRKTVDEKLNDTLEKRLDQSFKIVSERLEAVHKGLGEGLGEMQNLAKSVGNLNKVMNNIKSRGIMGEYQLQNLLEDLLTNDQYEKNVKTKEGSGAIVEFAVKMPNGNNLDKILWLPIDSKFPKDDYEALVNAYETSDIEKIEQSRKAFIKGIKKNAQDIRSKYIDPPNTTEYGIMFLPYESLFAEVLRVPGLFDQLQRDYKITITGPTTLSAFLSSLQMGFRTLAIEKRSSEVWDLLGAVKTEFGQFGNILSKAKKKLVEATNVIHSSEVRTRAIERKLRDVQELPQEKSTLLLTLDNGIEEENFLRDPVHEDV